MNLILLLPEDRIGAGRVRISGRRLHHAREVLRAEAGGELSVGMLGGRIGKGRIIAVNDRMLELDILLVHDPPPGLPLTVVLALPRPKVLRRVLHCLAVIGAKRIVLVNAARVEKSYWQTPFLERDAIDRQLILGLEQSGDTMLPEVLLRQRFRPFVQDELPRLSAGTLRLVAHPPAADPCPGNVQQRVTLVMGPEGGFVPFEVEQLAALGFTPVSLGERVLNVETAVPALIGRMMP